MSELKLCKDCRYYSEDGFSARCANDLCSFIDKVYGEKKYGFCIVQRTGISGCGEEGRYWEPRKEVAAA